MTGIFKKTMLSPTAKTSMLVALLLVSGAAAVQALLQTKELSRAVGSAGFTSASIGHVTLRGTLGQPFVGVSRSGYVALSHGFWHGGGGGLYRLPAVGAALIDQPGAGAIFGLFSTPKQNLVLEASPHPPPPETCARRGMTPAEDRACGGRCRGL